MKNFALIINKEKGLTSRDVVNKLNKILNTKKIGHTGTLDPIATGVLVCLVGKYTKLVEIITAEDKEYVATIKLGVKTDSLDITGNIIDEQKPKKLEEQNIKIVLNGLVGEYIQTIPLYSAVHINGKRLYEYARNNENVELPQNKVFIKEIEFLSYKDDSIKFRVVVSKGTYIRSLIQTICDNLNTIGSMSELIRTRQGNFKLENAFTIKDVENNNYQKLNIEDLLQIQSVEISKDIVKKIYNGNKLEMKLKGYILFKENGNEIALYYFTNDIGRLVILLKEN